MHIGGIIRIASLTSLASLLVAGCGASGDSGKATTPVPFATAEWDTDFTRHSVWLDEFTGGGPPKDGIPSIDEPKFVSVPEADDWLAPAEPVAAVELNGSVRAYPIQILVWHEIVNDELGGEPIAVTYCPLCNSTVAFSREVDGRTLDFGITGMLRNSDLVMFDRETESWWQQLTAEAVVGELTGTDLELLPSQILSWEEFGRLHPDGEVLSRETGIERDYGSNPYAGYDAPDSRPFLLEGEAAAGLPPKERVAAVRAGESAVVYPFSRLDDEAPVNDAIDGRPLVVFFDPRVASALDDVAIASGRQVGSAAVFERSLEGRVLTFEPDPRPGLFSDRQTGSSWDLAGRATAGALRGERLRQVPHDDQFWFALAAFFEDAEIRG